MKFLLKGVVLALSLKAFVLLFLVVASYASHQNYPGTSTRPILSDSEASLLSEANYLQGWNVEDITIPSQPDYVVGNGQAYTDIQAAVNAAINAGLYDYDSVFLFYTTEKVSVIFSIFSIKNSNGVVYRSKIY